PANSFVGTFIGSPSMNLLRGKLVGGDSGLTFEHESGQALPLGGVLDGVSPGAAVDLGVRPEHFAIGESGFEAKVVVVEPTGAETQIVADIGTQRVTAIARDRVAIARGDTIHLVPDRARVRCFDA